jgi:putative ABC transport system ATP-binding protein
MIEVKNLVKTYQTGEKAVHALKGVSLDIGSGEFMSIAGPSGSGKTTLLNIIGCIDNANEGEIVISGNHVATLDRDQLAMFRRENLGFVFQSFNLIPVLSAFENVALVLDLLGKSKNEVEEQTNAILKEVGLEGMGDRLPTQLSGGQQQRVAIARALVKEPSLVLADEPTANLDSETGKSILDLMKDLNKKKGTTFIFSTHDQMVMDLADRVVHLHDGAIESDQRKG